MRDRRADIAEIQPRGPRQPFVRRDDADAPALEPLFHHRAETAVERKEQVAVADPRAIGRVDDHETRRACGRDEIGHRLVDEAGDVVDASPFGIGCGVGNGTRVAVKAVKAQSGGGRRRQRRAQLGPAGSIEGAEILEAEAAVATWRKAHRHLGGFDHEGARAAHRIDHRLGSIIPAAAQEQRRQRFTHRGLAGGQLVAALVQTLARGVEADLAQVVLDPHAYGQQRLFGGFHPQRIGDGVLDTFGGGPGMIDAGFAAGRLHPVGDVGAQQRRPFELARPLVELREMHRPEPRDPRQHAPCPAQHEIGAPDLGPVAVAGDPAGYGLRVGESQFRRFVAQQVFQPRRAGEEDFERCILCHGRDLPRFGALR